MRNKPTTLISKIEKNRAIERALAILDSGERAAEIVAVDLALAMTVGRRRATTVAARVRSYILNRVKAEHNGPTSDCCGAQNRKMASKPADNWALSWPPLKGSPPGM